jgi:hypothetical protein
MANLYEFCWSLRPRLSTQWKGARQVEGFTVELNQETIKLRIETDHPESEVRERASIFAESLVSALGYAHSQSIEVRLSSMSRKTGDQLFLQHFENVDVVAMISGAASWKMTSADGTLVISSEDIEFDQAVIRADRIRKSESLQRMLSYVARFRADERHSLAPLYDVIKLLETEFKGRKNLTAALGVSDKAISRATGIMNRSDILVSRHPGETLGPQREIASEELAHCLDVVTRLISAYENTLA